MGMMLFVRLQDQRRLVARLLLTLLIAVPAGIALAPPAFACSCAEAGPASYVSGTDVIVTGTISGPDTPGPGFPASTVQYEVRVDQVYRGEGIGRVVAVTSEASGAACGWEFIEEGVPYVVFANYATIDGESSEQLWGSLCGGTQPATPELVAAVDRLTAPPSSSGTAPTAHPRPPDPDVPGPSDPDTPWLVGLATVIASLAGLWLWGRGGRTRR